MVKLFCPILTVCSFFAFLCLFPSQVWANNGEPDLVTSTGLVRQGTQTPPEEEYPLHRRPPSMNAKLDRLNTYLLQAAEGVVGNFVGAVDVGAVTFSDLYDYAADYPIWGNNMSALLKSFGDFSKVTPHEITAASGLYRNLDASEMGRFITYVKAHRAELSGFIDDPLSKPESIVGWPFTAFCFPAHFIED